MSIADKIISRYKSKHAEPVSVIAEEKLILKKSDAFAKASVESLIENKFSVDTPTKKDAVNEMMQLAESNSFVADKMMRLLDDVTSNCTIDKQGNITLNINRLKRNY